MRFATPAASMAISARSRGFRHFGDRRVGDDDDAAAGQHQRGGDQPVPGLWSTTCLTSSSALEKLRVTPVTMASASPCATIAAAK